MEKLVIFLNNIQKSSQAKLPVKTPIGINFLQESEKKMSFFFPKQGIGELKVNSLFAQPLLRSIFL
ncbi:hypothetical protein AQ505_17530 [Pedobacter sp. PACM 27299]|nr:hypothetical protein AQ505_17530 [Pedobacter sp. PACM 27299]